MSRVQDQLSFNSARESLRRQHGVTLVELMVALALGLLITVAMLKVYVDASRMYRFNEGLARVQENGRFALQFIRRDARVAGFWGCYSEAPLTNQISTTSDAWLDVAAGHITGTNDDGLNSADSITFRSATGNGSLVNTAMTAASDAISVDSVATITSGMAALISDCDNGDIFQVTGISGTSLAHAAGTSSNTSPDLSMTYAAGSRLYQVQETTYCVADGAGIDESGNPIPSLRRAYGKDSANACETGDELVEGIQNMQILYGEDTDADSDGANGDGTANRYVAIDTADLDVDKVVSVRLSLLARSLNNNLTTTPSPYTFNGVAATLDPTDKYLRKVFTTTIALRNKTN
jgi:type IV pilus assembly protein PilW